MSNSQPSTKVVIGPVRLSYVHIWAPKVNDKGEEKYQASLIIPKSDKKTIASCEAAISAAKERGKASVFKGKTPSGSSFKNPLRDGDTDKPEDKAYENSMFINSANTNQPGIVSGPARTPVVKPNEIYSGCYAYVSLNFYPFNVNGNIGIAAGLNNIWKVKEGEPLGGPSAAESDFADVEVDFEDDFLS